MKNETKPEKNLFITGKPGSGKTTLMREVSLPFLDCIGGFYTEEIREGNQRRAFLLKTFDGRSAVLAEKGFKSAVKLNKYGINLDTLDKIGVDSIVRALREKKIIVVDEVGSMEVLSGLFRKTLLECLNDPSCAVLGTIRYNSQPFTDEIKKMPDTGLVYLDRSNFPEVKRTVKNWLAFAAGNKR